MLTGVRNQPPVMMPNVQTENRTQATSLGANISGVREASTTLLSGEIKGTQLEDYPGLFKQSALETLFNHGKNPEALKEIFSQSDNVGAKRAVTEFAGLFSTALKNINVSGEAKDLLRKLGEEYTGQILKDGLKEKSAFGPWTPKTEKTEAKLKSLNNQLLAIINNSTGGNLSTLTTNFVTNEVMPYITNCIEQHFGCELDPSTRSNILQLVDRAAAKAVDALDACHQKLTAEQGTSLGMEARHLEAKALIPLLLRNVFAQIPVDKLPDPKIPEPAAGPVPDSGKKPDPVGINININIDNSNNSVDNSQHNNSRSHVDNSTHDHSQKTIDNSRTLVDNRQSHHQSHSSNTSTVNHNHSRVDSGTNQTEQVRHEGALKQGITDKIDVAAHATVETKTNISSESTDGKIVTSEKDTSGETVSFDEVDSGGNKVIMGKAAQVTVHGIDDNAEHSQTADIVDVKQNIGQQAKIDDGKNRLLQSEADIITGNKTNATDGVIVETDRANEYAGLKFKQNAFLSTVPSITNMRSMHFNARERFLEVIRKALEPDTSTPFTVRRKFDELRGELLPNDTVKSAALKAQCSDINHQPDLKAKIESLKTVISSHPQKEKLSEIAKSFAREAGLTKEKGNTDYLLGAVLDGVIGNSDWRKGPEYESYLNKPQSAPVILTVDGLHMSR
ncbi:TPA: SPI-1 type III secretion system effector SipA [Salmonella enterica]|nr:SPI-1 type III secretion system effector SipA [Salmonella enterica]